MAAPTVQAVGTAVSGIAGISPAWPAHAIGDIGILLLESAETETASLVTAAGFVACPSSPIAAGSGFIASGAVLTAFWCRATSTSMSAPTTNDPGNHIGGLIFTIRGAKTDGDPFNVSASSGDTGPSTTTTWPSVTTTAADCRVLLLATRGDDSAAASWSSITNAALTSITEHADAGTTSGNGGGWLVASGLKAAAGAIGTTTATVAVSGRVATLTLAVAPPSALTQVTKAHAVSWNVAATVSEPYASSWHVLQAVSTSLAANWDVSAAVSRSFAVSFDVLRSAVQANRTNTAEGQTAPFTVTAASETGGGSGDAFDTLAVTGTGTLEIVNSAGNLYRFTSGTGKSTLSWSYGTAVGSLVAAFDFEISALPGTTKQLVKFNNTAVGVAGTLIILTGGQLGLRNSAGLSTGMLTTGSLALNTRYRVELAVEVGTTTTNGTLRFGYYLAGSTTPVETVLEQVGTANAGTANVSSVEFGTVTTSFTADYDNLREKDGTTTFLGPYRRVTKAQPVSWDVQAGGLQSVTKSHAVSWHVAASVSKPQAASWHVRQAVTKAQAASFDVRSSTSRSLTASWNVAARILKAQSAAWDVRAGISRAHAVSWTVNTRTTRTLTAAWDVRQAVAREHISTWNVQARISRVQIASWNVSSTVARSLPASWTVRGQAVRSLAVSWDVQGTLATVTRSLAVTWNVAGTVSRALPISWDVRVSVNKAQAASWNVRSIATRALPVSYNVRAAVSRAQVVSWNARGLTARTLTITWDVQGALTTVTRPLAVSWQVRAVVTRSQPTSWAVHTGVARAFATAWTVNAAVSRGLPLVWDAHARVLAALIILWDVQAAAGQNITLTTGGLTTRQRVASALEAGGGVTGNLEVLAGVGAALSGSAGILTGIGTRSRVAALLEV